MKQQAVRQFFDRTLASFVDRLDADELTGPHSTAAQPHRTLRSRFKQPPPPQPVEGITIRFGGEIVGTVFLRRRWMEQQIASAAETVDGSAVEPSSVQAKCRQWLDQLSMDLGVWLASQAEFLPSGAEYYRQHENDWPAFVLDGADDLDPIAIRELLWVPIFVRALGIGATADSDTRRLVKSILRRAAPTGQGRPGKICSDRKAVQIAEAVDRVRKRLEPAFQVRQSVRTAGGYEDQTRIEAHLAADGYSPKQIEFVFSQRTLTQAVNQVVGAQFGVSPTSVSALASQGRKAIRSQR